MAGLAGNPLLRRLRGTGSAVPSPILTLDELGVRRGLDQSSLGHDYLATYERILQDQQPSRMVIISGRMPRETGEVFAERFPETNVTVVSVADHPTAQSQAPHPRLQVRAARNFQAVRRELSRMPAPDVIIEDGTNKKSHKLDCFRHLFLFLADRGLYLVEDLHASFVDHLDDGGPEDVWGYVSRLLAVKSAPEERRTQLVARDDVERARAMGEVTHLGKLLVVRKVGTHLLNARDADIDDVLEGRREPVWGQLMSRRPPFTFRAPSEAWQNRPHERLQFDRAIEVPALSLRAYRDVTCAPLQLAVTGDVILPNSFHLPLAGTLRNKSTVDCGSGFARLKVPIDDAPLVEGPLYHLDSWLPGHFGHIMTEDWGRLWGWAQAKQAFPRLRVLISADDSGVKPFRRELLSAFGIVDEEILCIDSPVRAEWLVAASPMFHNHRYVDPAVDDIWTHVGETLAGRSEGALNLESTKIFIARPPSAERECHNERELTELFAEYGFRVVRPELLPLAEQARTFRNADVVAGFGGSGTFGAMFGRPRTMIVISSESYYTTNEWMIASVKGAEYAHFWCPPDVPQPPNRWDARAFQSGFAFDFERDGTKLRNLLDRIA